MENTIILKNKQELTDLIFAEVKLTYSIDGSFYPSKVAYYVTDKILRAYKNGEIATCFVPNKDRIYDTAYGMSYVFKPTMTLLPVTGDDTEDQGND